MGPFGISRWPPNGRLLPVSRHLTVPCLLTVLSLALPFPGQASGQARAGEELEDVRDSLTEVRGTSVHANEEEPRVLHIVPWQPPTLTRRDRTELTLPGTEKLLEPIDVEAFRTHRHFRQTLDVLNVDRSGP